MEVKPTWRSSSWSHESCFARTVEEVCFQRQIFGCIVGKVSRNWLMDVFKYTLCILPFLFRDSLTCIDGISGRFEFKDIQWLSALHAWFARSLLKVRGSLSPIKLEKNEWNKTVLFDPLCYTVMFDALIFSFSFPPESTKTILFHSFFSSLMGLRDTRALRRDLANQA